MAVAAGTAIAYNDPPLDAYEWPTSTEVSEPVARGGPLAPIPGPLSITSIGASGAYDPDAPTASAAAPTSRCSRCGQRSEPALTATAPSSIVASVPDAEPTTESEATSTVTVQPDTLGLFELVNRDRAANGCGPVAIHPDLMVQSQAHAERQASDDTMHHSDGVTGFDTWGENVAAGYDTAPEVHDAWMTSPGHRANILNCTFTLIGWGAADGLSGRYWTEQFGA